MQFECGAYKVFLTFYLEELGALDVPGLDGGVRPGGEEPLAAGVGGHCSHGPGVAPELLETAAALHAPAPRGVVRAPCEQDVPGPNRGALALLLVQVVVRGDEDQGVDSLLVTLEGLDTGALLVAFAQV